MRFRVLFLLFLHLKFFASAQEITISGRITDGQGKPIPFTSVSTKDHKISAIANEDGYYKLSLVPDKYVLVFSYIGYKPREVAVLLKKASSINIEMEADVYRLEEVIITSPKNDPALAMIKKVIAKRKNFQNEAPAYSCDVYVRGVQKLTHAPKKILGRNIADIIGLDASGKAILYQSETYSRIYLNRPDKKEIMIASKVAGDNKGFSFNSGLDLQINFYNNLLHWDALGNSNFVSPIADNATEYYRYKLTGSSVINGRTIHKIQVSSRSRNSPAFNGDLYILEGDWRLYSVDLTLTSNARINFVDTLQINQNFVEVEKNVWKQSDISLRSKGKVLGFEFEGYFVGLNSHYTLNPEVPAKFFNDEILKIPADVNKQEADYWIKNRPSPLTNEEFVNYYIRDSIEAKKQSRPYLDSLQRKVNKFRLVQYTLTGYRAKNLFRNSSWYIYPLHNTVFYNTVEGWGINFRALYNKQFSFRRYLEVEPNVRYGFTSKTLNANAAITYKYDTLYHASLTLKGGTDFLDLNNRGTINQFYNTLTTLFDGKNYLKLYRSRFLSFRAHHEISDGLQVTGGMEIARRYPVQNAKNLPVFENAAKMLTSNNPLIPDKDEDLFPINNAFVIEAKASYTYGQRYTNRPDGKIYESPRYPTIQLDYRKGVKDVFHSAVDYDFISADLFQDKINMGLLGYSSFYLSAGKFLNSKSLYYPDIHHFTGNQTAIYNPIFPNFHFLNYYAYSTTDKYFEAHYEHNFSGLLIRKLPLLRQLKLEEIVGGAFLTLPSNDYKEVYFGLQRLLFRIDYGYSWSGNEKPKPAFRLFYGF
ncbi:MAG TPA: hypothetical protein DIT07_13415 [Sphingobacteriaceae bacterium]|nr:hypothetical protein [Sphingobacteriaceae bacterium]